MPYLDPKRKYTCENKPFKKTFDFWLVFFIMPFQKSKNPEDKLKTKH